MIESKFQTDNRFRARSKFISKINRYIAMTKPNKSDAGPNHPPLPEAMIGGRTVTVRVTQATVNGVKVKKGLPHEGKREIGS